MDAATNVPDAKTSKLGQHLKNGLTFYAEQIQQWLLPMLVAAAIGFFATIMCYLPLLLVYGPLLAGLSYCAICCVRRQQVTLHQFWRPWNGDAVLAGLGLAVLQFLPALIMVPIWVGGLAFLMGQLPFEQASQPVPLSRGETIERIELPEDDEPLPDDESAAEIGRETEAAESDVPFWILPAVMLLFYGGLFAIALAGMAWAFWLCTRTMFVLPLIADRELGAGEAFRLSWRESKVRFWELLLLQVVSSIIGYVGLNACYVGALFSLPAQLTILACVYVDRFPNATEIPPEPASPPAADETPQ